MENNNDLTSISSLLSQQTDMLLQKGSSQKKAFTIWISCVSERERKHTKAVYVKENKNALPTLIVYIDTPVLLQDFLTNKNLYIDRLTYAGFAVKDVDFKVSRYATQQTKHARPLIEEQTKNPLPELSQEEKTYIHEQTAKLDKDIASSVSRAMEASFRKNKNKHTDL